MSSGRAAVSALVLSLNEELLIGRCLDSLSWADEVVVLDSGSSDRTREIAREHGARVVEQPWLGWSAQRTRAMTLARHDWVFFVEADELVTPKLERSIRAVMGAGPDPRDGFSVDRRTEWMGVLLPNEQRRSMVRSFVRLFHRGHSAYDPEMVVHERVVVPGTSRLLDGTMLHWRPESLTEHTRRALRYVPLEAQLAEDQGGGPSRLRVLALPVARLLWLLVVRRNVGLGTRGVLHTLHRANGEWMRQVTLYERAGSAGLSAGAVASVIEEQNSQAVASAPRWLVLWRIWTAVPRLFGLAARRVRVDEAGIGSLLDDYARWNSRWLTAGKRWEQTHDTWRLHPPSELIAETPE